MSDSSSFIKNVVLWKTCTFTPFPDNCARWTGVYLDHEPTILLLYFIVLLLSTYRGLRGLIYPLEVIFRVYIWLLKYILRLLSDLLDLLRPTQSEDPQIFNRTHQEIAILGPSNWKNVQYNLPLNIQVPPEFICPITQEIMKSPVLLSDGHAYEEAVAVRLLESGVTSPFTRESLRLLYIRNTAQRRAIIDWVEDNNGSVLWQ